MRKLLVVIMIAVAAVLSSCGGPSAPAPITKALQTQVASDIKGASVAYDCTFVEKSLTLVGSFKASSKKLSGDTVYIYVVSYTYTCQDTKDAGEVVYYVTVDKNGKVVDIA